MVRVAFIVEGDTELELVRSKHFRRWLKEKCDITLVGSPNTTNCKGNGNLCEAKRENLVRLIRKLHQPDYVVLLADLDPTGYIQCITQRKQYFGKRGVDLIIIARNAIEAWFLADTQAIQSWLGKKGHDFYEYDPEFYNPPWDRVKTHAKKFKAKFPSNGVKLDFAKLFIEEHGFDLERAANHKNCPSASYCVEKLKQLGNKGKS